MKYCKKCGAEKVEEWTGRYDEDTGKKEVRLICSVSPCEHSGCNEVKPSPLSYEGMTWWQRLTDPRDRPTDICSRCGKEFYYTRLLRLLREKE